MNTLICYKKCTTCKGVENIMKDQGLAYELREIDKENPSIEELKAWREKSGLPLKRFFNTSGKIYKDMGLSKNLADMSEEDQYKLLATDGMLVKRPILLVGDEKILVGPDVKKFLLGEEV
ncbi:ArsC/Spx/MgsR family protein [Peptostreptococcus stomatis]|uniref:ArsC/Spx/MgsR family protein n=1 Tax=Peptostreptococcus stomatis TaxID=341694 RepID=UPI003FA0D0C0